MMSKGTLFVIAAPSGAGKTSLVDALVKSLDRLKISISYTTRPKRPAEQEGIHYHFVTEKTFEKMIEEKAFLEFAKVYDCYYGTSNEWVEAQLQLGIDVILEIDWQGAEQVGKLFPDSVSIFILPPSRETLEQRLRKRNQDTWEIISRRLQAAHEETLHYRKFDYLIVNEVFEHAVADLRAIVEANRLLRSRQEKKYKHLLEELTE